VSLSDWDIDFRDGALGEATVAHLMSSDTVEVKTDRRWYQTGNVYIEMQCWYQKEQRHKPSGIHATKASHWAFVLEDLVLIVPLDTLKRACIELGKPIACNIQPNPSSGVLIKINDLLNFVAQDRQLQDYANAAYESYREPDEQPSQEVQDWLNA